MKAATIFAERYILGVCQGSEYASNLYSLRYYTNLFFCQVLKMTWSVRLSIAICFQVSIIDDSSLRTEAYDLSNIFRSYKARNRK